MHRVTEHPDRHRGHHEPDIDVSNLSVKEGRMGVVISQDEKKYFLCGDVIVGRLDASADSSPRF